MDEMAADELLFLSNLDDKLEEGGQISNDEKEQLKAIEKRIGLMVSKHYNYL